MPSRWLETMGPQDPRGAEGLLLDVIYVSETAILAERRGLVARRLAQRGVTRSVLDSVLPGWSVYLVAQPLN